MGSISKVRIAATIPLPAYQVLSGTRVVIPHGTTYRLLRLRSRAAFDPRDLRQPSGAVVRDALAVGLANDPVARLAPPEKTEGSRDRARRYTSVRSSDSR